MSSRDYLADLEQHIGDASLDGPGLTSETLGALLGIGQQLKRIADPMEPHEIPDPDASLRAYLAREGRK